MDYVRFFVIPHNFESNTANVVARPAMQRHVAVTISEDQGLAVQQWLASCCSNGLLPAALSVHITLQFPLGGRVDRWHGNAN
jgi:hypothetical protein